MATCSSNSSSLSSQRLTLLEQTIVSPVGEKMSLVRHFQAPKMTLTRAWRREAATCTLTKTTGWDGSSKFAAVAAARAATGSSSASSVTSVTRRPSRKLTRRLTSFYTSSTLVSKASYHACFSGNISVSSCHTSRNTSCKSLRATRIDVSYNLLLMSHLATA